MTKMEYTRLGSSGLKVSKIILGGMIFGSSTWEGSPWTLDEEAGLQLLKKAYDCGINTWDTADTYSNGASERIIGKALKKYNIPRSKVVLLTKIYNPVMNDDSRPASINDGALVNQMGLSRKHIFDAVDACLARLDTDYIEKPPPEEIMRALHDVVQAGKVRYLGASSMYTWEFARLQYIAEKNNWTPFISMQPFYNLLYREEEREMIPFCNATGVGVIPWSPLARGLLSRPIGMVSQRSEADAKTKAWFGDANEEIVRRVEKVAGEKGVNMALVATSWVLAKGCWPIIGLSSVERIEEIVKALAVKLTEEECEYLESEYKPRSVQGM